MASPARPGALVDAASAPTQRGGRLIDLAKHAGRFAFAYLAFEIALSGPLMALALPLGIFVTVLSAPIAWLPFYVALHLASKARIKLVVGCLLAGAIVGVCLAIQLAIFFAWLSTMPLDTSPPSDDPFSWLRVLRELPGILKFAAPIGAMGGLVFWAVYALLPLARLQGDAPLPSPERPRAPVDATPPARGIGRLTGLANRVGEFALAYAAFEIVATITWTAALVGFVHIGSVPGRNIGAFLLASTVPIAWMPFSLSLYVALRARIRPIIATLLAVTIAGAVLAFGFAILSAQLERLAGSRGIDPIVSWLEVALRAPGILLTGAPGGAGGGLVFWIVYFRLFGSSRPATCSPDDA